ncbi:MAG: PKD domain-containing protein [Flavobacteriales bacterium]
MFRKVLGFAVIILCFISISSAQVYEIENGTVTACGGQFYDDNGGVDGAAGTIGSDYSPTSYTYTICPETPGDGIQVSFIGFSVSQNPNPDNNDVLLIFNGDSTGAPLMGNSNTLNFSGITFSATADNPSGCLTFSFTHNSNNSVTGGWQADIACVTPCSTPIADGTILDPTPDVNNAIQGCIGQSISFGDVGSTAASGFTLENFIWNFGDGESSVGPSDVVHTYDEPGEYIVTLVVEDNNGCQSTNVTPYQILISTVPIYNTDFSEEVCLGGTGFIDGNPVQGITWTSLPPQVVSGTTFLADGVGFEFDSNLDFNFFEDDQILESCDDLFSIDVNMEHSYIGDLDIVITCPDGTEVILLDFPNGGGGGYLGEPVDIGGDFTPGVGYDYSWTPEATNGTFGDNAIGAQPLPSGVYETEGNLCDLVGCPLNGQWTMTIVDNLGADDGNIFEWGISLNSELFPGVTTFTPQVGLDADSSYVTGDFIDFTSDNANYAEFTPPALGEYEYLFTAVNNFGCTTDTTVIVTVVLGPELTLPEEIGFCGDEFELVPEITNEFDQGPCMFSVILANDQNNGFNGANVEIYIDGVLQQTVSSFQDEEEVFFPVPTGSELSLNYLQNTWGELPGNFISLYDDAGNELFVSATGLIDEEIFSDTVYCSGEGQLQFEWSPSVGLDNPNVPVTAGQNDVPTVYTLTTFPEGFEGCATSAEVLVFPQTIPNLGEDTEITICESAAEFEMLDALEGDPEDVAFWYDAADNQVDSLFNPAEDPEGTYTYRWTGQDCPTIETDLVINIDELFLTASSDTTICQNGSAELTVELDGTPTGEIIVLWNGGIFIGDTITVQPNVAEMVYQVQAEYGDGCVSNMEEINITTAAPLDMLGLIDEQICLGDSVIKSPINPTGGLAPYNFVWTSSTGMNETSEQVVLAPEESTNYCLEITDACESDPYSTCFDVLLNEVISTVFTANNNTGCFPILAEFSGTANDLSIVESMQWDFGDGTYSSTLNFANHNYTNPGVYDVTLTITDTFGCVYENTEEAIVEAYNIPDAQFTLDSYSTVLPNNDFEFNNLSTGNDLNFWTFDEFGESTEENPTFETDLEEPAEFQIELVVQNFDGCSDTVKSTVFIVDGFSLFAPTSFTPNGDGINDVWKIAGIDIDETDFTLNIWNRHGNLIFQTLDPDDFWDGSYDRGQYFVPNGVYTYQILTRARTSGDKKELSGMITIMR